MNVGLIIGNNIRLPKDAERITSINRDDVEYTLDDEGKLFIGDTCQIDEDGVVHAPVDTPYLVVTADFGTDPRYKIYIIDATAGNVTGSIDHLSDFIFIRRDNSGNTVSIEPTLPWTINGGASVPMNTQYLKYHVVTDGSDFYY